MANTKEKRSIVRRVLSRVKSEVVGTGKNLKDSFNQQIVTPGKKIVQAWKNLPANLRNK